MASDQKFRLHCLLSIAVRIAREGYDARLHCFCSRRLCSVHSVTCAPHIWTPLYAVVGAGFCSWLLTVVSWGFQPETVLSCPYDQVPKPAPPHDRIQNIQSLILQRSCPSPGSLRRAGGTRGAALVPTPLRLSRPRATSSSRRELYRFDPLFPA